MRNYRELPPGAGSALKILRIFALLTSLHAASVTSASSQGALSYIQHVSAYGGATFDQGIRNRDLDKLVQSYNQHFTQLGTLKKPLTPIRGGTGYYLGISAQLFMMEAGIETSRSTMQTTAEDLHLPGQRIWDFNYQTTALNFTFWLNRFRKAGESSNDKDGFVFEAGIPMAIIMNERVSLRSGYRYQDGYTSYGSERPLNGIYHFSYGNDMGAGIRLLMGTRRYRLMAEWMAVGLRYRKDPKYGIGLSALDHHGSVPMVGFPQYLPDDVENVGTQMQFTGITAQDKHAAVTAFFRGNRFRLGLLIDIL